VKEVSGNLRKDGEWLPIGTTVAGLAGEFFLVTGSGKFFRNIKSAPEANITIIEINESGDKYRICWGLTGGGVPTCELPTHLTNHEVKKKATNGQYRIIYHAHPSNTIALTFVLPLNDEIFTRELWEMMPECPVVFPKGIGIVDWMPPSSEEIAIATGKKMETYDVAVWAHHGMFCAGDGFGVVFGLMETVEKAAEILVKVLSMAGGKRQTIGVEDFRKLDGLFGLGLDERFLFGK
jgi:rhamnulose-1-phosphate aldolase